MINQSLSIRFHKITVGMTFLFLKFGDKSDLLTLLVEFMNKIDYFSRRDIIFILFYLENSL